MSSAVESALAAALAAIAGAKDLDDLKSVKISHVGDKSDLGKASQSLGKMPPEERAEFGKVVGAATDKKN